MSTIPKVRNQQFVFESEPWQTYIRLRRTFKDRPGVRITFDRGVLELVTLSHEHEFLAELLAMVVKVWTQERKIPRKSGGSNTLQRRDRQRGLEPDKCFWIAHQPQVRNLTRINLRRDPPPDLVIETDITHSSVPRLPIFAALAVPEVWRFADNVVTFHVLQPEGAYSLVATSQALAPLSSADVTRFLALRDQVDENTIEDQFRDWVRQLPNLPPTP